MILTSENRLGLGILTGIAVYVVLVILAVLLCVWKEKKCSAAPQVTVSVLFNIPHNELIMLLNQ